MHSSTTVCACVWSFRSPASTICQTSSTVCSSCSPQHLRKPWFFWCRTSDLEFSARWFV